MSLFRCRARLLGTQLNGVQRRESKGTGSGEPVRDHGCGEGKRGWREGAEERNPDPSRCHVATPEEHARTRCVISDCLPGFVDGWVISSGGGDRTTREKESGRGWMGGKGAERKGSTKCNPRTRSCDLR